MIRCFHEGITFKKLPEGVDPRGPQELTALHRARTDQAWRRVKKAGNVTIRNAEPSRGNVLWFAAGARGTE